jgi:hypothetical protein
MRIRCAVDELGRDEHPAIGIAHAALHHRLNVELARDRRNGLVGGGVALHGGSCHDPEAAELQ